MTWPSRTQQIGLALLLALLVLVALLPGAPLRARPVNPRPRLVAILGPTATGKSALGIALAIRFGGEVVSCDSTAVYRGFDIGTDKVPVAERRGIPHHLIDVADPLEEYSAARYAREASAAIRAITARGRLPILVGGTGLYYRALDAGASSRARHATTRCAPASSGLPTARAPSICTGGCSVSTRRRRSASRAVTASA